MDARNTIQCNTIFFISVHLSQGMRINDVHVHYANFALIIVMNLTNFNNILTSRLVYAFPIYSAYCVAMT